MATLDSIVLGAVLANNAMIDFLCFLIHTLIYLPFYLSPCWVFWGG